MQPEAPVAENKTLEAILMEKLTKKHSYKNGDLVFAELQHWDYGRVEWLYFALRIRVRII